MRSIQGQEQISFDFIFRKHGIFLVYLIMGNKYLFNDDMKQCIQCTNFKQLKLIQTEEKLAFQ